MDFGTIHSNFYELILKLRDFNLFEYHAFCLFMGLFVVNNQDFKTCIIVRNVQPSPSRTRSLGEQAVRPFRAQTRIIMVKGFKFFINLYFYI